jgi:predicted nuclease of restriction endonuclease-like (RecB) superfamily
MDKSISILNQDYILWVEELVKRYRCSQIKASIKVNRELVHYYWELGKDIEEKQVDNKYGSKFYATLSRDLRHEIPDAEGLSETSIRYARRFYLLYNQCFENLPQFVEESCEVTLPQVVENLYTDLFSIPWGHHRYIIDKCSNDADKALFFVRQTLSNGWSRDVLLNALSTNLYERSGKALTNFKSTLPDIDSDLAQELTRDPYDFSFTGLRGRYNERILKDTLLSNITNFLLELGTGFAYIGKEYRLQIAEKEKFVDLLFYNLNLSCYVVVEVKIGEFDFADAGQLGGYVVACNHLLRKEGRDNPTIGLLICKQKNNTLAQYALESSSQPLGISEYELEKLYPERVEGTMPSIKEIEAKLKDVDKVNEH